MKKSALTFPEIALIAGTRGILGTGAGLLLSEKLKPKKRRTLGWALFSIGVISTIPLAIDVFRKRR